MRKWNEIHQKQQNIRKSNKESFKNLQEIDSHFSISVFPIRGSRERWIEILFTSCRNKWLRTTQKTTRKPKRLSFFLCLIAKDWGTFSNHTRTCEHTHTAQKHISPFTVRSQASTYPSIEKHCSAHTYFDYRCSLSSTFCLTLSLPLPIYIWVERGTKREKSAKKWSFFCDNHLFYQLHLTEQAENIFSA